MEFEFKLFLGFLATMVALINYLPYLSGVVSRKLHPHAFSWIIFTVITASVSVVQFTQGAGSGAWATGATAFTTFLIACFALRNGGYRVTRSDVFSLIGALLAVPIWLISEQPLLAVMVLTLVETLGFIPTYRKAWRQPHDESSLAFFLTITKYALSLAAMQIYSLATVLFPAVLILLSFVLLLEIYWRRNNLGRT